MAKLPIRQHKKINDLLVGFYKEQIDIFDIIFDKHIKINGYSVSKMFRMAQLLSDIIKNNKKDYENLFLDYLNSKNVRNKLTIRYGSARVDVYNQKMKSKGLPKPPYSIFDYNFWMKKGLSETEAKEKVTRIQIENAKKRNKESYKNFSKKLKYSKDYWINLGYSEEESEILKQKYLKNMKNDLLSTIERYGEEEGRRRWVSRCEKYKQTMKNNLGNKRTGGCVSKESISFFIPLYKFCRRLGLKRNEIYFGIGGSREFFIKDNTCSENSGCFYDFTIPKLNMIIEYHGTFWHPRNINEWKNPWLDYNSSILFDEYKAILAKRRNMDYFVVWSDDNKTNRLNELSAIIKERFDEH